MSPTTTPGGGPAVSIVLPTYNRAAFLPRAFEAIRGQRWADWELIVVDDGSTDDTAAVVGSFAGSCDRPVHVLRQANRGAYAARNAGLAMARGRYVAFYDSDDLWLPHHLSECVGAMEANPGVDWVYAASRVVEEPGGRTLARSTFRDPWGRPMPFLRLRSSRSGALRILDDRGTLRCAIR